MDDKSRAGPGLPQHRPAAKGEEVPFMALEDNRGFLQKLAGALRALGRLR